jgi:hypothetical protein
MQANPISGYGLWVENEEFKLNHANSNKCNRRGLQEEAITQQFYPKERSSISIS